jgi:hypothetical protein
MSHKDYVLLANALMKATPLARDGEAAMRTWALTVQRIAGALSDDNPRFDRAKFIKASEGG